MYPKTAADVIRPIVLAPMAGGPSTPALCAAVAQSGGLPFLAGGYLTPEKLESAIADLASLTREPFGINLFVPNAQGEVADFDAYLRYRQALMEALGADESLLVPEPRWSDDFYEAKLAIALESDASIVSFTFGHPRDDVLRHIQEAGKQVALYATSRPGIDAIERSCADIIGIQGPGAGGHRATVYGIDDDSDEPLLDLIDYARASSTKPIIAGGGVSGHDDVAAILRASASAVQVGTLFLSADEAGTKPTHRRALCELRDRGTVITRAFTGWPARAVRNRFTELMSDDAPGLYPQLHFLTAGLRAQANESDDMEHLNLWAGTGFAACTSEPAAAIMSRLLAGQEQYAS